MNILLISPNTHVVPYPVYPLGLDYVAGSVNSEHTVQIADLNIMDRDALAKLIKDFAPNIIGLSLRNVDNTEIANPLFFIERQKELIAWLREVSEAIIVCGGAGFTILARDIFDKIQPDYGIVGEGERFAELVHALEHNLSVEKIPGLITSNTYQPPVPWMGEQTREPGLGVHTQFYVDHGGMLNLQSKRGCSFRCIYCPYPHIEGSKHRRVEAGLVAQTALDLQERGAKYIFLTDSAFNSDVEHSLQVAEAFQQAGLAIPWGGFFAPLKLPENYFKTMKACGLSHIEFGTESLSDTMLKSYQKPFRKKDVFATHQLAIDADIHIAHYYLLGGPGETAETLAETLDGVEQLQKTVHFFFTGMRIYPHTKLYDISLEEGKISKETSLLEPFYYESDAISPAEIETQVKQRSGNRINWIVGSGGDASARTVSKMHGRGFTGPLWEFLVR
jgi:radical SAM superfamily enzyme YgiQ (UPF0313 family)